MDIEEVFKLMNKQQEEYFKRLDKIAENYTRASIVRNICFTIALIVYFIGYFTTPYLTKNYNNINAPNGEVQTYQNGGEK
jgi:hypothetical protein